MVMVDTIDWRAVGRRIKNLREGAGWTQKELATRAGLSESAVAYYEQGRRENVNTLVQIVNALRVNLSLVLGGPEPVQGVGDEAFILRLVPLLPDLDDEARAELLRLARVLSERRR